LDVKSMILGDKSTGRPNDDGMVMIAHITLATRDVLRSVDFFRESLGWQPVARPGNISVTSAWLEIAPGMELHLLEDREFAPSPFEKEFGRHIAITFPLAEFPHLKSRLQARGATLIEPIRETPFARFFFRDPDGYVFEVVEENHDEPRPVA
jgi:catechol 2,3-dioxygenase-like lactoylglutathione lyase family enzyme